jgi:hypothetical protein
MSEITSALVVVGAVIYIAGVVWTHVGARHSRAEMIRGIRLRYVGITVMILTIGVSFAVTGFGAGPDWGRIVLGLVVIGFGALWLYGLGGITPRFPAP